MSRLDDILDKLYIAQPRAVIKPSPKSIEAAKQIVDLFEEIIGPDELIITTLSPNKTSASYRNKFRADLRNAVRELLK